MSTEFGGFASTAAIQRPTPDSTPGNALSTRADQTVMQNSSSEAVPEGSLRREISSRNLNMIAMAGSVGTGLIIGVGSTLALTGPAWVLISFCIVGLVVWFVLTALGEMAAFFSMKKGFAGYATKYVHPALGFATGWNYFFKYVFLLGTNLTASGMVMQYWLPGLNTGIWVTVFGGMFLALNFLPVRVYGDVQFYLGSAKLVSIAAFLIAMVVVSAGANVDCRAIGFTYWKHGAFRSHITPGSSGRFLAGWYAIVNSCFAYTGVEVVGASFGEATDPKRSIPKAIRLTAIRILTLYIGSVFLLTLAISPESPMLRASLATGDHAGAASPFIIAVKEAGIPVLPGIFNFTLLFFVLSAANADIYTAARTLSGLAKDGQAPRCFRHVSKKGVPVECVVMAGLFIPVAYMNCAKQSAVVFGYLVSLTTVFGVLNWVAILVSYDGFLRALRAQSVHREQLPYRGLLQPYGAYVALGLTSVIILFNGWEAFVPVVSAKMFFLCYIGVFIFAINMVVWKYTKGLQMIDSLKVSFAPEDGEEEDIPSRSAEKTEN